jgi:U4/U6 small nuclear ribonucleoprotein PRP3
LSRKRKDHEGGGGVDEADREAGKRARAYVDPPPPEERPRRERRRFDDVEANGDERGKGDISSREQKNGEVAVNSDLQSGATPKVGYRI